jgi:hypothetical protein
MLVAVVVLVPAGAAKAAWTHPVGGQADDSWAGTLRYETEIRDAPLRSAVARMQLDGSRDVVVMDARYPVALVLAGMARHVWIESAVIRAQVPITSDDLVARIETDGTWLLVAPTDTPMAHALAATYADCREPGTGDLALYHAWLCKGRKERLDAELAKA